MANYVCYVSRKGENKKWRNYKDQQTHKGEHDYSNEDLALINQPKLIMNLWRTLMFALDTEFNPTMKPLPKVFNLNLLWTRQLPMRSSIVSNSSLSQHTLQQSCRHLFQILVSDLISQCLAITEHEFINLSLFFK